MRCELMDLKRGIDKAVEAIVAIGLILAKRLMIKKIAQAVQFLQIMMNSSEI